MKKVIVNCTIDEKDIKIPMYQTETAAGMDVHAWKYSLPSNLDETLEFNEEGFILKPLQRVLVKSGIHVAIPDGYEIQVRPRSGLALKHGITVLNSPGTVDSDYRGDVGILLINTSDKDFVIKKGERIGQLVLASVHQAILHVVDQLDNTDRGQGGFGSTGVK